MSAAERMICHECRKQLKPHESGAWHRCCDGFGYWTQLRALPADRCGGERNGLTFCPSAKWWRLQK